MTALALLPLFESLVAVKSVLDCVWQISCPQNLRGRSRGDQTVLAGNWTLSHRWPAFALSWSGYTDSQTAGFGASSVSLVYVRDCGRLRGQVVTMGTSKQRKYHYVIPL